jgi:hypothetical protein
MVLSVTQNTGDHRPMLVQAPVRALDPDGIAVVSSGTVAFVIGAIACWLFRDNLATTGRLWYFDVAIAGTVIGMAGLAVGLIRGRRRRSPVQDSPAEDASVEEALIDADGVPDRD